MAYNQDEIYKKALKIASEKNVYFIDDIITSIPISTQTFYKFFPVESKELDSIKAKIDANKVTTKKKLRKRWDSDDAAPVLQIALYKIIGTEEESDRINSQRTKLEVSKDVTEAITKAFEGLDDEEVQP